MSGPVSQYPRYVSFAEASKIVGVSPRTLRRAVADGCLRAHRLGRLVRIDVTELTRWIEADGAAASMRAVPAFDRLPVTPAAVA